MTSPIVKQKVFGAIYMLGFFFALTAALPAYVNSEFLSQFVGTKSVGIIYAVSSLIALVLFTKIGKLLKQFGGYKIALTLAIVGFVSLIGLTFVREPLFITLFFIAFDIMAIMLYFTMDIFLETSLQDRVTGTVRGTFLIINNTAWIMAPILAGLIVSHNSYWKVYLASAAVLLPVIIIIVNSFRGFHDSTYENNSFLTILTSLPKHKSTYKILSTNFILQLFYSWMVIYTPIYLRTYMGFDWQAIGIMFTVMLFPFAILEAPLGRLADEKWGEKEMLTGGLVIMGVSTMLLTFIPNANFLVWTAALLTTRIGASIVEIMSETYFFKKTGEKQPEIVSLFRMTKPLAFITGPLVATILLQFIPYNFLFLILGIIMFWGLRYSLTLKDTL